LLTRVDGRDEIVLAGAESLIAYAPATGEQLWIRSGFNVPHPYARTIAGAPFGEGVIVAVASGFQNRVFTVGVKAGGKGDLTDSPRLWTATKFSPDCSTPVIYEGKVYFIRDDGIASRLDLKTARPTETTLSTPSISQGRLFIRTEEALHCLKNLGTRLPAVLRRNPAQDHFVCE